MKPKASAPGVWLIRLVAGIIFVLALAIRVWNLDTTQFWVDEAESAINALTILEHGYPSDEYLGLPIYENTMVREWLGHAEYEFDDLSYSDSGMAVYHGWLPLYSIAISLKLFGIEPDSAATPPKVLHDQASWRLRTIAPRLPSVFYSALFMVALYFLGQQLRNESVGLIVVFIAAFAIGLVEDGIYARYYAATTALTTLCGLVNWRLLKRGGWLEYLTAALVLALMFHTHSLSFAVHCIMLGFFLPKLLLRGDGVTKIATLGTVVGLAVLPWLLLTGYLEAVADAPKARSLLNFPGDLIEFPSREPAFSIPVTFGLACVVVTYLARRHLPARWFEELLSLIPVLAFLILWSVLGFLLFLFFIPAASYFESRINLVTVVPGILLFAVLLDASARLITPRIAPFAGLAVTIAVLWAGGKLSVHYWGAEPKYSRHLDMIELMRAWNFQDSTRIYSTPNVHLIYQYFAGLPVQSIAAVRSSFLTEYEGDVIVLDHLSVPIFPPLDEALALERATDPSIEADEVAAALASTGVATTSQKVSAYVANVYPQVRELSPSERRLSVAFEAYFNTMIRDEVRMAPILRGPHISNLEDWWYVFLFRFADLESHRRDRRNYLPRMHDATALVLPWSWVVFDAGQNGPAVFRSDADLVSTYRQAEQLLERGPGGEP